MRFKPNLLVAIILIILLNLTNSCLNEAYGGAYLESVEDTQTLLDAFPNIAFTEEHFEGYIHYYGKFQNVDLVIKGTQEGKVSSFNCCFTSISEKDYRKNCLTSIEQLYCRFLGNQSFTRFKASMSTFKKVKDKVVLNIEEGTIYFAHQKDLKIISVTIIK